jgi:osmotically-inducible protein OsmY
LRLLALVALLVLADACSRGYRDPHDSVELQRGIEDRNVATRVRMALAEDPETAPYDSLRVSCKAGVITLEGAVDRSAPRIRAERLAQGTRGVLRVVNEIAVNDPTSPD